MCFQAPMYQLQDVCRKAMKNPNLWVFLCYPSRNIHKGLKSYFVIPPTVSFLIDLQLSRFGGIDCKINIHRHVFLCNLVTSSILLTLSHINFKFHVIYMAMQHFPFFFPFFLSKYIIWLWSSWSSLLILLEKTLMPYSFMFLQEAPRALVND